MRIVSVLEDQNIEKRIAITPEIAKKYITLGFEVCLSRNYGEHLGFKDDEYKKLGVEINNNEFSLSEIDKFMAGVAATFSKTEVVILSIESKAYHEWVISLMDGLQQLGFQNIQIKTYTD